MDTKAIELIEHVFLYKENREPKVFESGTVLRVIMRIAEKYLVQDDSGFSFTLALNQENQIWKRF